MAVQESASQLSMTLKVQEYPTLKVGSAAAALPRLSGAAGWAATGRGVGGRGRVTTETSFPSPSREQGRENPDTGVLAAPGRRPPARVPGGFCRRAGALPEARTS